MVATHNCRRALQRILICLLSCCLMLPAATAQRLERATLEELSEDRTEDGTELCRALSNTTNIMSISVPAVLLASGYIGDRKDMRQKALYIGESLLASSLISAAGKQLIHRQRPFSSDPLIIKAGTGGSASFPSGHTTEAFAAATSLSIAYPKWYVIAPSFLWAGAVGYSRAYLGVHYPSDIIAGAIVGAGTSWLCYRANRWLQHRKG